MHILTIEDDRGIGQALQQGMTEEGHDCVWRRDGDQGLAEAHSQQFDAIVLDLMLPGRSGIDVLRELRGRGVKTPVVILTAKGTVDERVTGLQAGADDYLVKPFAFAELMARIEAVCRRTASPAVRELRVGDLALDLTTRRVRRNGEEIDLSPTEFSVLELLAQHAGHVVTRKMLCEALWESHWEGTTNVIDVHINRLRRKLGRGRDESLIQTVRGRGYAIRAV